MKIALTALQRSDAEVDITIHSLERSLYQARVHLGAQEVIVCDNNKKPLSKSSLTLMRDALAGVTARSIRLVQSSPYDEMIGQPEACSETIKIPLVIQRQLFM